MNIFVGNLSFDASEEDVRKAFAGFGSVASVVIVMEKNGRKSRGFGFVEMSDDRQAQAAIDGLNGKELKGRILNVLQAHPKTKKGRDIRLKEKFQKRGRYKTGRRSLSFMKKRAKAGIKKESIK